MAHLSRPVSREIGRLGATAMVGDVALLGAAIPRAATVRALNATEVLRLPAQGLQEVLRSFPGCLQGITGRLKEARRLRHVRCHSDDYVCLYVE